MSITLSQFERIDGLKANPEVFALRSAISHARCVLAEPWQSSESKRIAQANLTKYRERLASLGAN